MKIVLSLILFISSSSLAYTPPNGFILNQLFRERSSLKELYLEGKITDLKSNAVVKEKLSLDFQTGKLVSIYLSPNDEVLGSYEADLKNTHRLGKFWIGVALDSNGARFKKALEELDAIPRERSVAILSRIGTKVVWSWGEDTHIDFYKDEFLAARFQSGSAQTLDEIFIKEYSSPSAAIRIPKVVSIRSQGQDQFRYELKAMKVNTPSKLTASSETTPASPTVQEWTNLVR